MIAQIKKTIQKPMINKQHRLHEARIASQTVPYDVWINRFMKEQEQEIEGFAGEDVSVAVVDFDEACACGKTEELLAKYEEDVLLFVADKTCLIENAETYVQKYVKESEIDIFYADELHYFKPDYSPELLESYFYFGNVFGITKQLLSKTKTRFDNVGCLVKECLKVAEIAGHMEEILYTGVHEEEKYNIKDAESLRLSTTASKSSHVVSVIIPSKDNPAVLSTCIHSVLENTEGLDEWFKVEIIVVDNGSNDENRKRIEKMCEQLQEKYRFKYHYEKMTFNFSHMCNLGASLATGDFLLFLNDDIEVKDSNWLDKMMYQAVKPGVGAVGAKLLYPDGERIQHAGITNIHLGPAHKLQFASDKQSYYMGYNRRPVNVLAVTGACMLMKKKAYEETGGFDETLQVSFNDVEICFHLYALGYRNVCCNNTYLFHHESLSRGSDAGLEKIRRLHKERDYLYGKYPQLWNYDPYYSAKFVNDILDDGFEGAYRFEETQISEKVNPVEITGKLSEEWHNECLYMGVEFAGSEKAWINGPGRNVSESKSIADVSFQKKNMTEEGRYYIQGWSYAVQVDNSRYNKKLLLKPVRFAEAGKSTDAEVSGDETAILTDVSERIVSASNQHSVDGALWELSFTPVFRPDMASKLPYIERPELTGVSVWFDKGAMPKGEYLIGYLWEDTCSRQKLYAFTAETIVLQ